MTEEPRRSGRATKGVTTKNQEEPNPQPQTKPKASKSKAKGTKQTDAGEEEKSEEEIIRCICGFEDDDEGGRAMICCENCEAWQHNDCMGVPTDLDSLGGDEYHYECELCKPENHPELQDAKERGEDLKEVAARRRQEAEEEAKGRKKGKKGKGGRQSKGNETKSASPAPPKQDGTSAKRKHASDATPEVDGQPAKQRKSSAQDKQPNPVEPAKENVAVQKAPSESVVGSIEDLTDRNRKGCAQYLKGKFEPQLKSVAKQGQYQLSDGHSTASMAESLAIAVESAMFTSYCAGKSQPDFGGKYRTQMQAIASNTAQNPSLFLQLLDGTVSPERLATMPSDEMASEELRRQMATMKEEADKQSTLIQEPASRTLVRRTHKGEEVVDYGANQMASESTISAPPPRRRESEYDGAESPPIKKDRQMSETDPGNARSALSVDTKPPEKLSHHDRRSSSNFNISSVWSSVQSPDQGHSPPFGQPQKSPETQPAPRMKQEHDADIDRLLGDDDNDSAPYSPGDYNAPTTVWQGLVDMPTGSGSVAKFRAMAHHAAGSDLQGKVPLASIFPESLTLSGRIPSVKADEYLTSLAASRSTDVTVCTLVPEDARGDGRTEFQRLFTYFIERERYGVVSDQTYRDHVTDTYIVPLEHGLAHTPLFLQRLEYNAIESPRTQPLLLAVFVLKWRHGVPSVPTTANVATSALSPPGSVPHAPGSAMSPVARPGSNQPATQTDAFPGNPYAATASALDVAKQVLGERFSCPTAQELINSQPQGLEPGLLQNLKRVLDEHPSARTDFIEFQRVLAEQNKA